VIRWAIALAGFALLLRLVFWVVGGADGGWPPDEPYPGLRAILLVLVASLPALLSATGATILIIELPPEPRLARRLFRIIGFASIALAVLLADRLIGLDRLNPFQ
jgi:hypothetical protein